MAAKRRRLDGCLGNFQTAFAAFERRKKGRGVDHSPAVKTDDSSVLAIFSKRSDSFFFEETNRKAEAKGFGGLGKSGRSISFPGADFVRVLKERCRQLPRFFPAARERRAKKRLIVSTKRSAFSPRFSAMEPGCRTDPFAEGRVSLSPKRKTMPRQSGLRGPDRCPPSWL